MSDHDNPRAATALAADLTPDTPQMPEPQVREVTAHSIPGGLGLLLTVVGVIAGIGLAIVGGVVGSNGNNGLGVPVCIFGVLLVIVSFFCMTGVKMVAPGEARVIQLFGRYVGTIRADGLRWINPLTSSRKISTRVRNHETAVLKVNDAYGNPIELAAIVVWKVEDTAQALFEVDDFLEFVATQTEAAVRHIAIEYPYDAHDEGGLSLRGNAEEITEKLAVELTARVQAHAAYGSSSPASATSRTPPRSPPRCSSASRPVRWSRPGSRSSRARSAWSRWRSPGSPSRTSSSWTRSARRPWSAI